MIEIRIDPSDKWLYFKGKQSYVFKPYNSDRALLYNELMHGTNDYNYFYNKSITIFTWCE